MSKRRELTHSRMSGLPTEPHPKGVFVRVGVGQHNVRETAPNARVIYSVDVDGIFPLCIVEPVGDEVLDTPRARVGDVRVRWFCKSKGVA